MRDDEGLADTPGGSPAPSDVVYGRSKDGQPFAYRSNQVITTELHRALEVLRQTEMGSLFYQRFSEPDEERDQFDFDGDELVGAASADESSDKWIPAPGRDEEPVEEGSLGPFYLIGGVTDPIRATAELSLRGIVAQLNYVYFSHSLGGPGGGGFQSSAVEASPVYFGGVGANPVYFGGVGASPVYFGGVGATTTYPNAAATTDAVPRTSTAVPAYAGHTTERVLDALGRPARPGARIIVLDTGLAALADLPTDLETTFADPACPVRPLRPTDRHDHPQATAEPILAPAAGHGTFIAGVIARVLPGCPVLVGKVLANSGEGDEWTVAKRIHAVTQRLAGHPGEAERSILSLSFGAPVLDHPHLMAHVIADIQSLGVVVVASAGNDGLPYPNFPAALQGVVGVGALSPVGPAPFSNYGPWVDACAPGTDHVSAFFKWDGPQGKFDGWAIWSGTSFAGPAVAASIAKEMVTFGSTAAKARRSLIDQPWLMGIPNLGVVVNTV